MTTALSDPLVGQLLDGRYRIVARIARGGMATVYEAVDTRLDRVVAVKSMHANLVADEDFVARFIREARSAARLGHPNAVAVFDQGSAGDPDSPHRIVYLVMELVRGRTLRQALRERGPLRPRDALTVLEPVLAALRAAHDARIVHRDVKPENVLLADDGRVKVADFGLARALTADSAHTRTSGLLLGTVSYLAPEQVLGTVTDARADVYAAGILLFEMLTGTKPFDGDTPLQVAYKHVNERVPAPSTRRDGIPPAVDRLVLRATDPDPAGRFVDGRDFLAAVRGVAADLVSGRADPARPDPARPGPVGPDGTPPRSPARADAGAETTVVRVPVPGRSEPAGAAEQTVVVEQPSGGARSAVARPDPAGPSPVGGRGATRAGRAGGPGTGAVRRRRRGKVRTTGRPPSLADQRARYQRLARRRRHRGAAALAVVLVVAVGLGVAAWWIGRGRFTSVPSLAGTSEVAARASLDAADLQMRVGTSRFDAAVPAGYVLAAEQPPNTRLQRGSTVTVVVSKGTERAAVPTLVGLTAGAASAALSGVGLAVGSTTQATSDTQPAGQVAATDPVAGAALPLGTTVDLHVSTGPAPVDAPDVVGRSLDDARGALTPAGLPVLVQSQPSMTVAAGAVIGQDPGGGPVPPRTPVTLTVSTGRPTVSVPTDLRGRGVDAATQQLTSLGFRVTVRRSPVWVGLNRVWGWSPDGGAAVPWGTTVALTVI